MANKTHNKLFLLNYFLCAGIDDDGGAIAHRRDRIIPHKDALPLALITPQCHLLVSFVFTRPDTTTMQSCKKKYQQISTKSEPKLTLLYDTIVQI